AIHGDKTQKERIEALDAFKAGTIMALTATDVAARGLDIDQLPLVINYELPTHAEDYVHRIGRTGRAGASGEAVSLVDGEEERRLVEIEKLLNRKFPREAAVVPTGYQKPLKPAPVRSHHKTAPADDWFSKPYEPSASAKHVEERPAAPAASKPKPQVAALFRSKG
ncbi:MAG: ATP-dependent helicase, partial [Gallionellaceae bacterium]